MVLKNMKELRMGDEMWYDANRCTHRKDLKANICAKCDTVVSIQSEHRCQQCPRKMCQQYNGMCKICHDWFNVLPV